MLNQVFKQTNMMALKSRMLSRTTNPFGVSARQFSQVIGGQEGSTVSNSYEYNLFIHCRELHLLVITLLLTTSMMLSLSVLEELVSELLSVSQRLDSKLLVFQSFSQPDPTQLPLKEESMPLWVICIMMTGDGIFMTPSREVTGSEIKMLFNICAEKLQKLSSNSSHMVCHSQEPRKARSIKELSEVNLKIMERAVRLIDAALSQTELAIVCSILFLEEPLVTIAFSSSNISVWILLWKTVSAEVSWLTTWLTVPSTE